MDKIRLGEIVNRVSFSAVNPDYERFLCADHEHFESLERLLRLSELTISDWGGDRPEGAHWGQCAKNLQRPLYGEARTAQLSEN